MSRPSNYDRALAPLKVIRKKEPRFKKKVPLKDSMSSQCALGNHSMCVSIECRCRNRKCGCQFNRVMEGL